MIQFATAILYCVALQGQSGNVSDYFPLQTGTVWTYTFKQDSVESEIVRHCGAAIKIGDTLATPITDSSGTLYYAVRDEVVLLIGNDPKHPFENPRPILEFGAFKDRWHADYLDHGEPENVDGQIVKKTSETVLGTMRDVVIVRLKALVGGGRHRLEIDQDLTFARGVGLVEMESRQSVGNHSIQLRLKDFKSGTSQS